MRRIVKVAIWALACSLLPAGLISSQQQAGAAATLRTILSPSGQSAYDTTTAGSYFAVSAADYQAAQTNLSSVTKIGMTDTQLATCTGAWSSNGALVFNNSITIPANAYILGYAMTLSSGVGTNAYARLISSSTYKGSYDFLVTSNYPKSVSGINYYLFKSPVTSSSTTYLGTWANVSACSFYTSSATGGYNIKSSAPFNSWTNYTSDFPAFQILYTTVDQWASAPPTISTSLAGNVNKVFKGTSITITTSLSDEGLVTFKFNGKNIGKCVSKQSSSLSATCNWTPTVQGSGSITATLRSPTAQFSSVTSTPLRVTVAKRSNSR